jgi:hypothetical protein
MFVWDYLATGFTLWTINRAVKSSERPNFRVYRR